MQQLITILHILVAVAVIVLVLIQHGKGADVGAAFGSGASNTMFGSQGSTPFLVKVTAILAFVFFITSATLSFFAARQVEQAQQSVLPAGITQPIPTSLPMSNTSQPNSTQSAPQQPAQQ